MAPSRVAAGLTQSSSSSGIFFQGDGQSQVVVNTRLCSPYENSSNSIPGTGHPNLAPVSGDMSSAALNNVANSGPSVGASSFVKDANLAFSRGPHLQRSASINADSYMRLPASPMSFSSTNINMSGSSGIGGSSIGQHGSHQDPSVQKKTRVDVKQEDILQQQVLQQLLQRQDSMQLPGRNPQLQALIQQQRLRQQQMLQSMPPLQRAHLQQQMQLRQQLQQQDMQQVASIKRPSDGVCARRLMQYLCHQSQRPSDNTIAYWRKFVAEYYSPRAKKRWCLSLYDNVGSHAHGIFPQAAMDTWQCDICGSKSGRGFGKD
ncbi:hypothetical protein GOBAR_AA10091 [Gossypium barbadense]|uniref:Transcriptional regulator SLK2 n=1 Tax=Gossypium barbadense TaxID=3634 RepID=A0A2P5Y4L7_GOSBA|nr:hypothetical protein GOBAR_AA10091 [Gossypium barbadense]